MRRLFRTIHYYMDQDKNQYSHSYTVFFLLMGCILLLFFPVMFHLFEKHSLFSHWELPVAFILSTIVLMISTRLVSSAKKSVIKERAKNMRLSICALMLLGMVFLFLQYLGWSSAYRLGVLERPAYSYFLVLVIMHAFHFLIALILFLSVLVHIKGIRSSADVFIYFLQPKRTRSFQIACWYWDFLSGLWLMIFGLMLLKQL